jgi:chromosome segregation ATPase
LTTASHAEVERQQSTEKQLHLLKQQLAEAQNENGRNRQRLEKLGQVVLEREKKISELQRYEYSFRKINEQRHAVDVSGDAYREQLRELQGEKERLGKELEDSHQHTVQLDRVIRFLRERQEEAQLEINQFHEELNKAQVLIAELTEKSQFAGRNQQELEDKIIQERLVKEEALEEVKTLYSQFEVLKKMLTEAKLKSENIQAERNDIEASQEKLKQEEINKALASLSETESHLKIAQQHLAKKVKETSDLQDKVHSQNLLIQEIQSNLDQSRTRISEHQHSFEVQLQQEKRLQEQLCESARTTESLVSKWEEKYFNIYEKWKDNEMHLKEMKKIEAKHAQLQVLLANIGGFFETPMGYSPQVTEELSSKLQEAPDFISQSAPQSPVYDVVAEASLLQNKDQVVETSNMKKPYQNLFDMPVQNKRPKHNLFE